MNDACKCSNSLSDFDLVRFRAMWGGPHLLHGNVTCLLEVSTHTAFAEDRHISLVTVQKIGYAERVWWMSWFEDIPGSYMLFEAPFCQEVVNDYGNRCRMIDGHPGRHRDITLW